MKKIQTRIFVLDGIYQIGFQGINASDIEVFKELHHFRFNPTLKLWHISFHPNTINYLNNKFAGKYEFIEDLTERDKVPKVAKEDQELVARLSADREADILKVKHSFHRELYKYISQMEGAKYDRVNKYWILSVREHQDQLIALLEDFKFEIKELNTQPSGNNRIKQQESLSQRELDLISTFEKELFIRNKSRRTIELYLGFLKQFMEHFPGRNLQEINNEEIRDYLHYLITDKRYSLSTINGHISAIKSYYKILLRIDLLQITIPRPKKGRSLPKVIKKEDIRKMIESATNLKQRIIVVMLYSCGLRRQELLDLKLSDIDLISLQLKVSGKGNKERIVPLSRQIPKEIISYLKAYNPKVYLLEGPDGSKYSSSSIANILAKLGKLAGISVKVTAHMLRHSIATHMLDDGVSIVHIQKFLGHTNIKTTLIYTKVSDDDLRKISNPFDSLGL